ncbi:MAG: J domain-containing protein [Sphingomonadales bacterium]|nr:J domain-containing protein [Sphingomonadales bacterium]MDE2567901.1 J domain-containing protein [Sphingomonadales bacterium]
MSGNDSFIDYYKILQLGPSCSDSMLKNAYHNLAKMFHPDHSDTGDADKFNEVTAAYRLLKDPEQRSIYDVKYAEYFGEEALHSPDGDALEKGEAIALSDGDAHTRILLFLYKRRRENARDAGVGRFFVQEMLMCSDENFEFYIWYLKAKNFIEITEQGTLEITIQGVDHVISTSRATKAEKLLITQSGNSRD